jgi:hypothetical protein
MASDINAQDDAMLRLEHVTMEYLSVKREWRQAIAAAHDVGVDERTIAKTAATTHDEMLEILQEFGESG